jgi:hypothetical protein
MRKITPEIDTKVVRPVSRPMPRAGSRKSRRSTIGADTRRSTATKRPAEHERRGEEAEDRRVVEAAGLAQRQGQRQRQQGGEEEERAQGRRSARRAARGYAGSTRAARAAPAPATTTPTTNTRRHEARSATMPPSEGPTTMPAEMTAPLIPIARPRAPGGVDVGQDRHARAP